MKLIPYGRHNIDTSDVRSIHKVLRNDIITGGSKVNEFEKKISLYLKCKYSVACNSGTSALFLAMQSIGLKKNDIVIMPSINFIASYNIAKLFNAKIYLADVDSHTGQMTPKNIEECCAKYNIRKVKALIVMYNGGFPENAQNFYRFKKKLNCFLIEDACHALGAAYKFKNNYHKIGSCKHADISTFSLHPLKTITTAEGGIITTNSKKIFKKLKILRSLGIERKKNKHWEYDVKSISLNFRLNEIQSALGISQLKKIKLFISKRKKIYNIYNKELKNVSGLSMPKYSKNYFPSFHLCLAILEKNSLRFKEKFIKFMLKKNIVIQYHYIPIYKFNIFNEKYIGKNAEKYFINAISLPVYYKLGQKQQHQIISHIKSFFLKNYN
jgi:dTDP-4-amino-4,6-dideoxygalactose transaminase